MIRRGPIGVVSLAALFFAALTTSGESVPQRERLLFARQLDSGPAPTAGDLVVLEQGLGREITSARPVDLGSEPWQVVFYIDSPRSTPQGLEALTRAVEAEAERLTALADVRVVVAGTTVKAAEASRDSEEIVTLLDRASNDGRIGELVDLRRRTEAAFAAIDRKSQETRRRLLVEHYFAEEELREWQRHTAEDFLLGALADSAPGEGSATSSSPIDLDRPRALFLLRDGLDSSAADFVRGLSAGSKNGDASTDPLLERRLRDPESDDERKLARTLAALGWHVFPVRLGERPEQLAESNPDQDLATATGGQILTTDLELSQALDEMERTFAIRYLTPSSDGEPGPIDVRSQSRILGAGDRETSLPSSVRLGVPRWTTGVAPDHLATVYARRLLEDEVSGELTVEGALYGELAGSATVEAALVLEELARAPTSVPLRSDHLRVTVVSWRLDRDPEIERLHGSGLELLGERWILRAPIETADDLQAVVVVAEDLRTGAWGAGFAVEAEQSLYAGDSATTVETADLLPPEVAGNLDPRATTDVDEDSKGDRVRRALIGEPRPRIQQRAGASPTIMKIVPPRGRELRGEQRFRILLSTDAIRKIEFYLDGDKVDEDSKSPFEATIDLGPEATERSLRALALSRAGSPLGEDTITINRPRTRLGIAFVRVEPVRGTEDIEATAELALPKDAVLDRVELYRNEKLAATFTRPPFTTRLPGPARRDADFLRAVVYLEDGSFIEDVHLLGEELSDRVEVNLVEIYTVVTDQEGHPVRGLSAEDFEVRQGKKPITIGRFAVAEEVPLVLGLAVDTSSSMWAIMPDTRKAAARFLGDTVSEIDTAFVVDFDDRPRLAHPTTKSVFDLIESLTRLQASGATALYDSILFSLLQFEPGLGRKAIVLLSDGDDYNSDFGFSKVRKMAADSGIPIYFLALGGFDGERPSFRKDDLEVIAEDSGGRVFYVTSMAEVIEAYGQIGDELRSQYILAFATEGLLSDQEIAKIKVDVKGKKLEVRAVVGRD